MRKLVSIFAFTCCLGTLSAQSPLGDLEIAAKNAQQQWYRLASTLDARLTRMAPCDPAAVAAIEEIQKASTGRLTSLIAFTKAVAEQAAQDLAMARKIQRSEADYLASFAAERSDTDEERAGIDSQIKNLAESVRKRVSLTVASDELRRLEASVEERVALVSTHAAATEAAQPKFGVLVQALEKREAALRAQIAALEEERSKWTGYYSARMGRALVECQETGR